MARGKSSADKEYFNQPRVNLAFDRLPRYDNKNSPTNRVRIARQVSSTQGLPGRFDQARTTLAEIHRVIWLTWDEVQNKSAGGKSIDAKTVKRIGLWGQVWSLAVVWSLVCKEGDRAPMTMSRLRDAVYDFGAERNLLPVSSWKHELAGAGLVDRSLAKTLVSDTKELLLTLLYRSWGEQSVTPPIEASSKLHQCFAGFVFYHLSQSATFRPKQGMTLPELLEYLAVTNFSDPERCFWGVADFLGIREAVERRDQNENSTPKQTGLSWLEPSIWRYVTSPEGEKRQNAPDDLERHIEDVRATLGYRGPSGEVRNPIAVLSGPAHSGKKTIVGDFFKRMITSQTVDEIRFPCFWGQDGERADLPVLCIQTSGRDYISLCVEILVFLERAKDALHGNRPKPQEDVVRDRWAILDHVGGTPVLQSLLDRIGELHEDTPALFVFLDVRHAPTTDIRNLIRRYGIRRLVETLTSSNRDSRFLITTDKAADGDFLVAFRPKRFKLPSPTCARIRWYLSDSQEVEFESDAKAQGFNKFMNQDADGDFLVALAVLFGHADVVRTEFFDIFRAIANPARIVDGAPVDLVCRRLLDTWDKERLVPYIALIAASEDGVMSSTIAICIRDWIVGEPKLQVAELSVGLNRLAEISQFSRGFFLLHQVPPNFTEEETRFDEPSFIENPDYFRTWEFDPAFSSVIRRLLAQDRKHAATLRQAYRLIANQARSRAHFRHIKGMVPQRSFGPQLPERSVQAYIALLLSLEPGSSEEGRSGVRASNDHIEASLTAKPATIPMGTGRVFELGGTFDQATAIKYAYYVLLKSEADHDHRLSMTLDADLLRLHLYTLLCSDPGTLLHWDQEDYQKNRHDLPPAIQKATLTHLKIFDTETQAELLLGLSMAAFYAGHFAILLWSEKQLFDLLPNSVAVADHLSRAVSARVDLEIQIGRPLRSVVNRSRSSVRSSQSQESLAAVQRGLAEDMRRICPNTPSGFDGIGETRGLHQAELSAWLRLQARSIHIDDLVDTDAKTASRLQELWLCEWTFLSDQNSLRSLSQHGRTGRLNMKSSLEHFPILSKRFGEEWQQRQDKNDLLDQFESMVFANGSRLSRFSGSERALTLIDHARQLLLFGNPNAALCAVEEARRICFLGTSSDNIRLEVLLLETLILLALAELRDPTVVKGTGEPERVFEKLKVNIIFIDRIIASYGLELEKINRNVLLWRAQKLAGEWSFNGGFFPKENPLEDALSLAESVEAFGLYVKLKDLQSYLLGK